MTPLAVDPPFTVRALADRWECSQGVIRKIIDRGDLNAFRIGVLIRITAAEVERYEQCQITRSSDSAADMPSYTTSAPSATDASLNRVIGRAPRRRRAPSGKRPTNPPSLSVVS